VMVHTFDTKYQIPGLPFTFKILFGANFCSSSMV
jgi:hypothetical protein